jgi:WD40 repeat protein
MEQEIFASGSIDGTAKLWKGSTSVQTLKHSATVCALAFINERAIVTASEGAIRIWDVETAKVMGIKKLHAADITGLMYDTGIVW